MITTDYVTLLNSIATSTLPKGVSSMDALEDELWGVYLYQYHLEAQKEEASY